MQPYQFEDPRDPMEKASRWELLDFARANGVTEIVEAMPAPLMRQILRGRGLTNIKIDDRPLGAPPGVRSMGTQKANVVETDAVADLARQFSEQQKQKSEMSFKELRSELKARGVKFKRTDRLEDLKAKLNGQ